MSNKLRERKPKEKQKEQIEQGIIIEESSRRSKNDDHGLNYNDSRTILGGEDVGLMALFFIVGLWIRTRGLEYPNGVTFDEYHFGRFIAFYIRGLFFIDVHPPLVKLIFSYVAYLAGFDGNFSFSYIGHPYESDWYYYVRLVPAISNILQMLVIYITCRVMKLRTLAAVIVTTLFLLDNSQVVQSRFMLIDSVLLLFMQIGLLFSIIAARYSRIFSAKYHFYLFISGLFLALAMSSKFTALSYVGTVIVHQSFVFIRYLFTSRKNNKEHNPQVISGVVVVSETEQSTSSRIVSLSYKFFFAILICIIIPIIVVFMICVAVHFYALPYYVVPYPEGPPKPDNFDKYPRAMGNEYFSTLLPEGTSRSQIQHFSVRDYLYYLNVYVYHVYLFSFPAEQVHSSQTNWYEWVFATAKPIIYWQEGSHPDMKWVVNCFNPGFNWIILFLLCSFFALPFLQMWWISLKSNSAMGDRLVQSTKTYFSVEGTAFFIGWAATLIPFGFFFGPSFLYHYYPGACLVLLLGAIVLEIILHTLSNSYWRLVLYSIISLALLNLLLMFYFLSPWIYGTSMPSTSHDRRFLLGRWITQPPPQS